MCVVLGSVHIGINTHMRRFECRMCIDILMIEVLAILWDDMICNDMHTIAIAVSNARAIHTPVCMDVSERVNIS